MSLRLLVLFAAVALAGGCVPVTEPLFDFAKAEPNKMFLGKWKHKDRTDDSSIVIDIPEVKGNPKGLMRAVFSGGDLKRPEEFWFCVSKIGKHDYIQLLVDQGKDADAAFGKEGAFAAWQKSATRGYWIGKYTIDKDSLVVDGGNLSAFSDLMKREKFPEVGENPRYFSPPAGWLAKYLDKNGPATMFDGSDPFEYKRIK